VLEEGLTTLESVISNDGGLYFSDAGSLRYMASPGPSREFVKVEEPGGLAFDADGALMMGSGNSASNGQVGDATGPAKLLRIDFNTLKADVWATGLSMGNGVARDPRGYFYASNDFGMNIDRIKDGKTERGWATVDSGNGLAVDRAGKWLYANQTFRPAAIQRVNLETAQTEEFLRAGPEDVNAGLDGMVRDAADNLFVTANGTGEVWRVTPDRKYCAVLSGLPGFPDGPSAVTTGTAGSAFPPENIYVVTFDGKVYEVAGVAAVEPAGPGGPAAGIAPIRLTVTPRRARVRKATRFFFRASSGGQPLRGVAIKFGRELVRTGADGHARMTVTFSKRGIRRARAARRGYRAALVSVRVR
jgi:sugar lactone lactonase YvrE